MASGSFRQIHRSEFQDFLSSDDGLKYNVPKWECVLGQRDDDDDDDDDHDDNDLK